MIGHKEAMMPMQLKACPLDPGETVRVDGMPLKVTKTRRGGLMLWVPTCCTLTKEMLDSGESADVNSGSLTLRPANPRLKSKGVTAMQREG